MGPLLVMALIALIVGFFMQVLSDGFAGFVIFSLGILLVLIATGGRLIGVL